MRAGVPERAFVCVHVSEDTSGTVCPYKCVYVHRISVQE